MGSPGAQRTGSPKAGARRGAIPPAAGPAAALSLTPSAWALLLVLPAALLLPPPAAAASSGWHQIEGPAGRLSWHEGGAWRFADRRGVLPFAPDAIALGDDAFAALAGRSGAGEGAVIAVVGADDGPRAVLTLSDLVGEQNAGDFWRPGRGEVAWRVDWWLAGDRLIVVPDAPGQPVAISLADGLVENPHSDVFVQRMLQPDLWFGRRLRALELAAAAPRTATFDRGLRGMVTEQSAPLVLRLRAAALLAEVGDPTGRSLVLLTARSPAASGGARVRSDHQLVLPVPAEPCDRPPGFALHLPYDEEASRSYAIRLLPSLLGEDSVPLLRRLLGSGEERDRRDAALALGCLAQSHPNVGHRLAERPQGRPEPHPGSLAAVGSQGAGDRAKRLALALVPMLLLAGWARRR